MSHWGQKAGPSKVSLVVATLLRGAVLGKEGLQGCSSPTLCPDQLLWKQDISHPCTSAATTARVFNDALTLFPLVGVPTALHKAVRSLVVLTF